MKQDLIVVGGGIVGLATAWRYLERFPDRRVLLLEKEGDVGQHQSGHNSGVIHSGIYYRPGSHRARLCRSGKAELEAFCTAESIRFERCGKVIVAVDDSERPALQRIFERGQANGVACRLIDAAELADIEPHAQGVAAIHVPESGIVDYPAVCQALARRIRAAGGEIRLNAAVTAIEAGGDGVSVRAANDEFHAAQAITCSGLQADRVARNLAGADTAVHIVPFRGEYYDLAPEAHHLCRGLIYPVPDPRFPFLGVHFTRTVQGGVECGPNAVLALAREGYRWRDVNLRDLADALAYPGFQRLAARYWRMGLDEMVRSASKRAFVKALQRLVPDIRAGTSASGTGRCARPGHHAGRAAAG